MAAKIDHDPLETALRQLRMPGMAATLAARLHQHDAGELDGRGLVQALVNDQREHSDTSRIARLEKNAKFEEPGTLEDFDYNSSPERAAYAHLIRELTTLQTIQQGLPILLTGPVGTGKTLVAMGLGRLAIRLGVDVRFARTNALLTYLADGRKRGTWERRIASYTKPGLIILDNFAVREYTDTETLDLYELITGRPGKSVIITSGKAPDQWYDLFPDKALPLAEAFLDNRLVNTDHHIVMDGPSYRSQRRAAHTGAAVTSPTPNGRAGRASRAA
jgi:DNA replication protein DnaC